MPRAPRRKHPLIEFVEGMGAAGAAVWRWLSPIRVVRLVLYGLAVAVLYNAFFGALVVWTEGVTNPLMESVLWVAALLVEALVAAMPLVLLDALGKRDNLQAILAVVFFAPALAISLPTAFAFQMRSIQTQQASAQQADAPRAAAEAALAQARDNLARQNRDVEEAQSSRRAALAATPENHSTNRARLVGEDNEARLREERRTRELQAAVDSALEACVPLACRNLLETTGEEAGGDEANGTGDRGGAVTRGAELGVLFGIDSARADQMFSALIAFLLELYKTFGLVLASEPVQRQLFGWIARGKTERKQTADVAQPAVPAPQAEHEPTTPRHRAEPSVISIRERMRERKARRQ